MSPVDATIFAAITGLCGTVFGVCITYFGAIRLAKINNKMIAGLSLREAFYPELAKLQNDNGTGNLFKIPEMLEAALIRHQAAVNEYRLFLVGDDLTSFNDAWTEYYRKDNKNFNEYMALEDDPVKKAISRIEKIISFTIHKEKVLFWKL